jgi:tetratricopeptide (TPR) repeat protein
MLHSVFALFLAVQTVGPSPAPEDFKDAIAHAEALYYEARFKDSIQLLTRIDDQLRGNAGFVEERATTKLQLALSNIGLNDMDKAKVFLRELYQVDPEYVLDPQQFSPKVVALAVDAKKEASDLRCQGTVEDARKLLQASNARLLVDMIGTMKKRCPAISELEPQAADLVFKQGIDAYKKADYATALQDFRSTLSLAPKNELASDYANMVEGKLQVTADRQLLDWRKAFDAHQYREAGAKYRDMSTIASKTILTQADIVYREALSALVQEWNRLCPTGNKAAMDVVRQQIDELLPDPSFGQDLRHQMTECRGKTTGCTVMSSHVMMTRVKSRVNPDITRDMRNLMGQNQVVHARIRVDESGSVSVLDVQGFIPTINNAVRNAVERWKFTPSADENGARCVETELVLSIER